MGLPPSQSSHPLGLSSLNLNHQFWGTPIICGTPQTCQEPFNIPPPWNFRQLQAAGRKTLGTEKWTNGGCRGKWLMTSLCLDSTEIPHPKQSRAKLKWNRLEVIATSIFSFPESYTKIQTSAVSWQSLTQREIGRQRFYVAVKCRNSTWGTACDTNFIGAAIGCKAWKQAETDPGLKETKVT